MKTKIILLVAGVAVVTLSFTFASTASNNKKVTSTRTSVSEPAGGFALEDK